MNIQYNRTIWQNDQTALNAQHMNNVEEGILNIISAVNLIPNWVFSGTKPSYTASDVGADPAGTAASAVLTHNASVSAHSNVLAPKVHTHTLSAITNFPVVSASDNDKALTVVNGAWDAAVLPKELPTVTAVNNGKVLGVENGDWAIYTLPNQLPEVTVSDNKKMLTVVNGQWQAEYFNIDNFAGAIYGVSGTTTLYSGSWSSNTYNISVASLGEYDAIFFSPITALDKSYLETANIIITTSGTTVTFTCVTSPTNNIGLNYFIARGKQ